MILLHLLVSRTPHRRNQICRHPRLLCSIALLLAGFEIALKDENCTQDCAGCQEFGGRGNLGDCDDCVDRGRKDWQQSDRRLL